MITQEFYSQGKLERDFEVAVSCAPQHRDCWGKSQQCFIDFLVSPKFNALARVCDDDEDSKPWSAQLAANRAFWGSRSPKCFFDNLSSEIYKDSVFSRAMTRCRSKAFSEAASGSFQAT